MAIINKDYLLKQPLWESLSSSLSGDVPSIIDGDFNYIVSQDDKNRCKPFMYSPNMKELEDFMLSYDLYEIEFVGPSYTWSNNKDGCSKI